MVHNRTNKRITYLMDGCDKRIFMVSGCGKPFQTHEDEENIGKHIGSHHIHIQPQNTWKVEMVPNQIPIGINTYH